MFKKSSKLFVFGAANPFYIDSILAGQIHDSFLLPIGTIKPKDIPWLIDVCKRGAKILIDSGVHTLTQDMIRKYGLSLYEVLTIIPENVEGFQALYKDYVKVITAVQDYVWDYIEIDLGGADHKRRLRKQLEALGLNPTPVYHPFVDGWDYFDELASQYPRICLGNVAFLEHSARVRLVATVFERNKKYGCEIHALGFTPDEILYTYPLTSCDSSSWMSQVRFGSVQAASTAISFGDLPDEFVYRRGEQDSHSRAVRFGAYDLHFSDVNWNNYTKEMAQFEQK